MSNTFLRHISQRSLRLTTTIHQVHTLNHHILRPTTPSLPTTNPSTLAHSFTRSFAAMTTDTSGAVAPAPVITLETLTTPKTLDEPTTKRHKLHGRAFYESIGSPTAVVAPMVEQSELAWRLLSRRHSRPDTLCYTPMFHSRIFSTSPQYRTQQFRAPALDGNPLFDRPTIVQFCSNLPSDLLSAAKLAAPHCDAVDLNLGCPQGIARKGHYGSFLQEDPGLISSLITTLHTSLPVPVTAKIRVLETKEASLAYAKMCISSGASILTVHGRRREQKGHNTGLADWSIIRYIRDHLPADVVIFANGNILWHEDIPRCLAATGADAVMSAEGNLYNPAIFTASAKWEDRFPRMDRIGREYLSIIRDEILPRLPLGELRNQPETNRTRKQINELLKDPSLTALKSHLFKLWHTLLPRHIEIRNAVGRASTRNPEDPLGQYTACLESVEAVVAAELAVNPETVDVNGEWVGPDVELAEGQTPKDERTVVEYGGKRYVRSVPWYRCQPYYRPLPEEAIAKGAMTVKEAGVNVRKRASDEEGERGDKKSKTEQKS